MKFPRLFIVLIAAAWAGFADHAWAEPALWAARSRTATVYLFGTFHTLPKATAWHSKKIDGALARADDLWLEIPNADQPKDMLPLIARYGLDPEHPLSTRLSADQLKRLTAIGRRFGLADAAVNFDRYRPWLAALALSAAAMKKTGLDPASGVEITLTPAAKDAGKPVYGFETMEQQIRFFSDLPPDTDMAMLTATLDDLTRDAAQLRNTEAAWEAGDTDKIAETINGSLRDKAPDLYRILIADRNKAWAGRIAQMLDGTGVHFVAVGAGHLAGPDSLQNELGKRGIEVERQ